MPYVMSDEELLDALAPEHPDLAPVRQARETGGPAAATAELARCIRRRGGGGDGPESGPGDRPEAVSERGEELCRDLAARDWLTVPHPEDVPERLHSTQVMGLNDHHDFAALAQEYGSTGNHRYARECVARMLEWAEANGPLPDRPPTGATGAFWRTIFYTLPRTANWTRCLMLLRHCPAVTDDEVIALLKVILHHLRYAAGNQMPGMPNMIVHLHEQLIGLGEQWPEFAESRGWSRAGLEGLRELLDDYFYPDGAYIELCYFAHESFTRVLQRGERGEIELPPGYREKVDAIFDFPAYMVKPNGSYPSVNDNYSAQDPEKLPERRGGTITLGVEITGRPDLRYIESFGAEGAPPAWTSRAFPYAGFYVMRSDWSAEARYLVFDGGRSAGGHNHVDKLSFELYAYGNTLVTDSGCGGPWASAWRSEYFVGPAGHNTIMVDGRGQVAGLPLFEIPCLRGRTAWHEIAPEPLPNTWVSGRRFDCVRSRYEDGYAAYGSEQSRRRGIRLREQARRHVGAHAALDAAPGRRPAGAAPRARLRRPRPPGPVRQARLLDPLGPAPRPGPAQGRVPVPLPGIRHGPRRAGGRLGAHGERARRPGHPARPGTGAGGAHRQGPGGPAAGVGPGRLGGAPALAGGHLLGGGGTASGLGHGAVSPPRGQRPGAVGGTAAGGGGRRGGPRLAGLRSMRTRRRPAGLVLHLPRAPRPAHRRTPGERRRGGARALRRRRPAPCSWR